MSGDRQNTDSNNQGMNRRQFIVVTAGTAASIANNPVGIFDELAQSPISSALTDIAPAVVEMLRRLSSATSYPFIEYRISSSCEWDSTSNRLIQPEEQALKLWGAIADVVTDHLRANGLLADAVADMGTQGIQDDVMATLGTLSSHITSGYHGISVALKPALIELFCISPDTIPVQCNQQLGSIRRLAPNIVSHLENDTLDSLLVDSLGSPNELAHELDWLQRVLLDADYYGWCTRDIQFTGNAVESIKKASYDRGQLLRLYFQMGEIPFPEIQVLQERLTHLACDWLPRTNTTVPPGQLTPEFIARRAVQEINALPEFVKTVLVKNPGIMRAIPTRDRPKVIESLMDRCAKDLPGTIKKAMQEYFPDYQHVLEPGDEVLGSEHTDRSLSVDFGWPDDWRDLQGNDIY
jgi:hypothetical protein